MVITRKQNVANGKKKATGKAKAKAVAVVRPIPRPRASLAGVHYFKCALDPFGAPSGAKIPDGTNLNTIAMDFKMALVVSPVAGDGTGTIAFFVIPALPGAMILVQGTAKFTDVNGIAVTMVANALTSTPYTGPIIVPFPDNSQPVTSVTTYRDFNTRNILRARSVAFGAEVVPTGTALTTQGQAAMARMPMDFTERFPLKFNGDINPNGGGALTGLYLARQANFNYPDFNTVSSWPDSKVCSVQDKCSIIGRRGDNYRFSSVEPTWFDYVDGEMTNTCLVMPRLAFGTAAGVNPASGSATIVGGAPIAFRAEKNLGYMWPGVSTPCLQGFYWIEPGSEMLAYCAQGLPANYPLEITVRLCIEAEVSISSVFRTMTTPVPSVDKRALDAVADIQKRLPVAVSTPELSGDGWWTTLANVVSGVGGTLAEFGIPVLSPIAGVVGRLAGAIAKAL